MRKLIGLACSILLIAAGLLYVVLYQHPLQAVIENPMLIFWDANMPARRIPLPWTIGFMLLAAGGFWIAEDWFNFGQRPDDGPKVPAEPAPRRLTRS